MFLLFFFFLTSIGVSIANVNNLLILIELIKKNIYHLSYIYFFFLKLYYFLIIYIPKYNYNIFL